MTTEAHLPDARADRLVHSTFTLLISNGSGVVLGVTFWWVAARLYSTTDVGYGATAVQALLLLSTISLMSLGTIFPRFLYAAGAKAGVLLRRGYAASISVAVVVSTAFLLLTSGGGHRYLEPGLGPALFFVGAVVLWVIFTIEDAALVGFRQTTWVPVENTSFSVAKILLLPVFVVVSTRAGVFTAYVLPVVACTAVMNWYLWRHVLPKHERHAAGAGVLPDRRVLQTVFTGEYVGSLAFAAMFALPSLMVFAYLGSESAGWFQAPWLAGTSFDGLLFSFATSLMVEATARPSMAAASVRRSVRLAMVTLGPAVLVILVGAPWFLRIFGPQYAAHGTRVLQCLALALPFMAVNVLYVTYARLARRVRRVMSVQVTIAALVLGLCFLLITPMGITGAGVAFLVGQGVVAIAVFPSVVRQYRREEMSPGFAPNGSLVVRSRKATEPSSAPRPRSRARAPRPAPPLPEGALLAEPTPAPRRVATSSAPASTASASSPVPTRDASAHTSNDAALERTEGKGPAEVPNVWRRRRPTSTDPSQVWATAPPDRDATG
jgi:O-antigen/teichoic acid export membrane protein